MSEYSEQSYWDSRYQHDTEPFEWYQPFSTLRPYIAPLINNAIHRTQPTDANTPTTPIHRTFQPSRRRSSVTSNSIDEQPPTPSAAASADNGPPSAAAVDAPRLRVLVLGCGCSEVSIEVWRMADGKAEVHSVDYSIQVIEEQRRRHNTIPNLHFHIQDIRGLTFPNDYFDLVIDKATLDCLHCLDLPDTAAQLKLAVQSIHRVLRLGGLLLSVSHAPPEQRSSHFILDRLEVMKGQLELEKKEKQALRRATGAASDSSPPGSKHATPVALQRRISVSGNLRAGSRRGSMVVNLDAMPVPLLTQPVVHRLSKPTTSGGSDDTDNAASRTLTRTSSLAAAAEGVSPAAQPPLVRRASLLMDMIPAAVTESGSEEENAVALAEDELSAVYDSSDHYLYVVHKELVAPPPQVQGLHSVGDALGARRSSLIGLPGLGRRQSSISTGA